MSIEHVDLNHPLKIFVMGVDDPDRLKSSELSVLVCPNTALYSERDLRYALTRLRAGDKQVIITNDGSWPSDVVREILEKLGV